MMVRLRQASARNRKGAALAEYGILLGLIALIAVASIMSTGRHINSIYEESSAALDVSGETAGSVEPVPPFSFSDYTYDPSATDVVDVRFPLRDFSGPFDLQIRKTADSADWDASYAPCNSSTCSSSRDDIGQWQGIPVAADEDEIGWRVRLPATSFDTEAWVDFDIRFQQASTTLGQWSIRATRPIMPVVFEPQMTWTDATPPTGPREFIETQRPQGDYNTWARWRVRMTSRAGPSNMIIAACNTASCVSNGTSTLGRWTETGGDPNNEVVEFGYKLSNIPTSGSFSVDLEMEIYSTEDSNYSETYMVTVSRP